MGLRAGLTLLFVMFITCAHATARNVVTSDINATLKNFHVQSTDEDSKTTARNEQLCSVCEEYVTEVVEYFNKTETQSEIIGTLHHACTFLNGFKHKCLLLVDYYAPLFFKEIVSIQPDLFCEKVNLCKGPVSLHLQKHDDICTVCHNFVKDVLNKLEDPDTQLEIIQSLLKACSRLDEVSQQCKKLVFEYGPIILANAEKFFENTDLCAAIHACKSPKAASLGEILLSSA